MIALGLSVVSAIVLAWPAMIVVSVLGGGIAIDATLALRSGRTDVGATLVADISFTGIALVIIAVPPAAIGMVVAYFVLVVAVLGSSVRSWPIGLYAVVVGVAASVVPIVWDGMGTSVERSLVSGVIVVAVFGLASIEVASEFARMRQQGSATTGRRIEVADSIAKASMALVSEDESRALAAALEAIRSGMDVSVVFAERNSEDPQLGTIAVLVDRATDGRQTHPSLDRQAKVPWSSMPGARAHLEGGAPFFYRVEESRGTRGDRGGDGGLQVEVNVPIVIDGRWVGVIGAADVDPGRVWRTDDLVLLRTVADLTSAFWHREKNEKDRDSLIGTLDGRLRFEEAIAKASQALLGERAGGLEPALREVGIAAECDEVYITSTVPSSSGEPHAAIVAAWHAPGSDPTILAGEEWSYSTRTEVRDALQRGSLANEHRDGRRALEAVIEVGGAWFGSVGVSGAADRVWSDRDRSFIRTIGDMLGAFFERSQNRASLEASLQSKDQLIASVSHELRTPLTAVVGLAEELRSAGDTFAVDDRDQLLAMIAEESAEMADMVEDLLVAARSADGDLPVFPERIDLALLTQSVVDHLAIPEESAVEVDDTPSVAYADPVRVRQIVRNLLTNAFRYGGPSVTVSFGTDAGFAYVDVHDDGEGIPEDDRAAIFEAYGRSRSSGTVKASIGLGLTLSRRLADLMSGGLDYVDGPGCRFRLRVPIPTTEDR